jgi:hypothetical protein
MSIFFFFYTFRRSMSAMPHRLVGERSAEITRGARG